MKKLFFLLIFICVALSVWGQDTKSGSAGFGVMFSDDFNGNINGINTNIINVGAYAYGDFIYVELLCGLFYGSAEGNLKYLGAELGFYGKYPFEFTQKINLYPLLGFEFQSALFAKYDNVGFKDRDIIWKQYWFKTGAGLDYKAGERIRLRLEGLYGFRLKSEAGNYLEDGTHLMINDSYGHSITIRIAIGV